MPVDRVLAAWDDGRPVGVAASYPFELTIPGGTAPAAGVTWVGVLPSHRRRGILRELMRRQLEDVHAARRAARDPVGLRGADLRPLRLRHRGARDASSTPSGTLSRFATTRGRAARCGLCTADEAAELFPPLYESRRKERPGSLSRSDVWWRNGLLADPEHWRDGSGPKFYALLEIDGEPVGYALYRIKSKWEEGTPKGSSASSRRSQPRLRRPPSCGASSSASISSRGSRPAGSIPPGRCP